MVRADHLAEAGLVVEQIIWYLLNARFVVADLAGGNPNVMYELAIRHVTGKTCIGLGLPGEKTPYNIAALRVFDVDDTDPDSISSTRQSMIEMARDIDESGIGPKSPISEALGVWRLAAQPFAIATSDLQPLFSEYGALRVILAQHREELRSGKVPKSFLSDIARELDYLEATLASISNKTGFPSPKSYVRVEAVRRGLGEI